MHWQGLVQIHQGELVNLTLRYHRGFHLMVPLLGNSRASVTISVVKLWIRARVSHCVACSAAFVVPVLWVITFQIDGSATRTLIAAPKMPSCHGSQRLPGRGWERTTNYPIKSNGIRILNTLRYDISTIPPCASATHGIIADSDMMDLLTFEPHFQSSLFTLLRV